MASPFTVFRKNQKVVMAALVIVAIIAFVITPMLSSFSNSSMRMADMESRGATRPIVKWNGGQVDMGYAQSLVRINRNCQGLLARVAEEVIKAGGLPKVPGFQYAGPNQGMELGFTPNNPVDVIRTKILAEHAKSLGIEFDDEAVNSYIRAFADNRISKDRFAELMREQDRLSHFDLYRFLKEEFAKDVLLRIAMAGYSEGSMPMLTPGHSWQMFLRFQERARVEAFPVLVDDFLGQVSGSPGESELKKIYEEGKDRFPSRMFAEPGFMHRYEANIEFVSANLESYITAEKKALTDEQIQNAYNERVAAGRYQVPDTEAKKPEDSGNPSEVPNAGDDSPSPPTVESPDAGDPPAPEGRNSAPSGSTSGLIRHSSDRSLRLVSYQDPQPPAEGSQPTAEGSPQSVDSQTPPNDPQANPVAVTGEKNQGAAPNPPAANPTTTNPPAANPTGTVTAPPPMRTQTLDEVRDQLMRDLVIDKAREKMTASLETVRTAMITYSQDLRIFENSAQSGQSSPKPQPIDLQKLADTHGLGYGTTGMVNAESIRSLPIGKSRGSQVAFADEIMQDRLELFRPLSGMALDLELGLTSYVGWKVEKKDAYLPTFEQCKSDVEEAWRRLEARKLAKQKAEDMVKQLEGQSENPWTAVLNETERSLILRPNTFTWMQPSQSFQGAPQLSIVDGLDTVGNEFMRDVFKTTEGKFSVAANQPQTVYYVVRLVEKLPSQSELLEQFARSPVQFDARILGMMESREITSSWYEDLEKSMGVEWAVSLDELDDQ